MVVTAVIGKDHGIGVENLQGSGMIAGETARAYRDTFTLSYISGRCVGIGAYLVRRVQARSARITILMLTSNGTSLSQILKQTSSLVFSNCALIRNKSTRIVQTPTLEHQHRYDSDSVRFKNLEMLPLS